MPISYSKQTILGRSLSTKSIQSLKKKKFLLARFKCAHFDKYEMWNVEMELVEIE